MKRLVAILLAGLLAFTTMGVVSASAAEDLDAKVAEAEGMTTDQLIEKAREESGNFIVYGNSSRIVDAMDLFVEKYGEQIGLPSSDASASKQSDTEIFTLLAAEAEANNQSQNASMVLIQDSATLAQYREMTDYLTNYVPNGMSDVMTESDMVPLVQQYINKLFLWNNLGDSVPSFTNVWQLTEEQYKGNIFFKSPNAEQVNMNFLIMLTSDEWSAKLEEAYKAWSGGEADDVGDGKTYVNYGYKWIAEFLENCNFTINSDTTIAESLSVEENAGKMGLFVLSKLRSDTVQKDNLDVAAWAEPDGDSYQKIEPFAGFMYGLYAQLATNGPRPYTAMLFINFLMSDEGFAPWSSMGSYSSNNTIPVAEDDQSLDFWRERLVFEDGAYIKSVKVDVEDFINSKLPQE